MAVSLRASFRLVQRALHALSFILLLGLALASLAYTLAAAAGVAPWLTLQARFGDWAVPQAGMALQTGVTALLLALLFFVPAAARIMRLEQSHRDFRISMDDVARAYHHCHTADRAGVFTMSSEFDQVRERLAYLRDHPDLERLEPQVMEVAAQMSQQARHLAEVYSNDKVARARDFLRQRQEEAEMQQDRIVEALHACTEIRKWRQQVELEESVVASQLERLREQLDACLPGLGLGLYDTDDANIVQLQKKPAAE